MHPTLFFAFLSILIQFEKLFVVTTKSKAYSSKDDERWKGLFFICDHFSVKLRINYCVYLKNLTNKPDVLFFAKWRDRAGEKFLASEQNSRYYNYY